MRSRMKSEDVRDGMHRIRREKCKKVYRIPTPLILLLPWLCVKLSACSCSHPVSNQSGNKTQSTVSPLHSTWPSPSKPGLHLQTYSAGRLQHSAFSTHLAASSGMAHSSISENKNMIKMIKSMSWEIQHSDTV